MVISEVSLDDVPRGLPQVRHADPPRGGPDGDPRRADHHRGSHPRNHDSTISEPARRRGSRPIPRTEPSATSHRRLESTQNRGATAANADLPIRSHGPHGQGGQGRDRRRHPGRGPATDPPEGLLRHQDRDERKAKKTRQDRPPRSREKGGRKKKSFTIGRMSTEAALHLHPPALDAAGRRPADPAQPQDPRRPGKPGVLKNSLGDVIEDIESGATLSEAMAKHPKAFDRLYCNMIKAGEAGGALEAILQRLADFKEKAPVAQAEGQGGHGLPGRGHLRRLRDRRLHPLLHHSQVRDDLQRLRRRRCPVDDHVPDRRPATS